jgi:hypothetical protein
MAYDRYDPRQAPRDERPRWSDDGHRDRPSRDVRGFFERAGEEIAAWFGGSEDDRHRSERDYGRERERGWEPGRGPRGERDRGERRPGPDYRPMTGDYGRSESFFAAPGNPGRDDDRRTSFGGSPRRSQPSDPHYHEWRQRQMESLDRDYDEYRREHQSKFESDFGDWRNQRQSKRQMLSMIREQFEVVGSDGEHVGTVDRIAGDRIILTKSDPASGGAHHSLSCSELDRVEDNRAILGTTAEQAKLRWRDESRDRALFEREDQGEAGPHMLDRSFSGTYR